VFFFAMPGGFVNTQAKQVVSSQNDMIMHGLLALDMFLDSVAVVF
jgi:hypothetical protein